MRLDRLAGVVDPAVRPRLLDHGGEILLPGGVVRDVRPAAQRVLENPGGVGVGKLGLAGDGAADGVERGAVAFDHELERAKIIAVFQQTSPAALTLSETSALTFA